MRESALRELPLHVVASIRRAESYQQGHADGERKMTALAIAEISLPTAKGVTPSSTYRSQLEQDYADHLDAQRLAGEIVAWWYEPFTFNLGGEAGTRKAVKYKIDFLVLPPSLELEIRETKGYWRRGEREHLKLVAAKFPFVVKAITRESGVWQEEQF